MFGLLIEKILGQIFWNPPDGRAIVPQRKGPKRKMRKASAEIRKRKEASSLKKSREFNSKLPLYSFPERDRISATDFALCTYGMIFALGNNGLFAFR
jgi:hypothetical protein